MNRILWFLLTASIVACGKEQKISSDEAKLIHNSYASTRLENLTDSLSISTKSLVYWKGTKMRGLGSHEGVVNIEYGHLIFEKGMPQSGLIQVNMQTIQVTDIPETDPIPRKNLTEHLKNEDFFDVDNFPIASFEWTECSLVGENVWNIRGKLKIKEISKPLQLTVQRKGNILEGEFQINRFDWDIAYRGSWVDRTLVDPDILFRVELIPM